MIVLGNTYTVPRKVKGESRILMIFSFKSLVATIIGAIVGILPGMLFYAFGLNAVGFGCVVAFAALGFGMVTLKIPDSAVVGKFRKAGGEIVGEILFRTLTFNQRKKIYVYREGGKKQWKKV